MSKEEETKQAEEKNLFNEPIKEDVIEVAKEKSDEGGDNKKKNNKWVKYFLYLFIILGITATVLGISLTRETQYNGQPYLVYQTIPFFFKNMGQNEWIYFALFILSIIVVYLLNSFILFLFARLYTKHYKYHQAVANQLTGVFYSDVTPGIKGGEFAQAFTFRKQGLPISTSASILVMCYIVFQFMQIICGCISMFKLGDILAVNTIPIQIADFGINLPIVIFIIVSFLFNVFIVSLLFFMSLSRKLHAFVLNHVINFLGKIRIIKKPDEFRDNLRGQVENFRVELRRLMSNIPFTILVLLLTFLTKYLNDSLPCICGYALKAFDSSQYTFVAFMNNTFTSFCYMNFQQMISGIIPIPGGAGVSEFVFNALFSYTSVDPVTSVVSSNYFTPEFIQGGGVYLLLLLWRFGTYYLPFMVCGVVAATYSPKGDKNEGFYKVDDYKKTFLTIQLSTLDERKKSSMIQSFENQNRLKEVFNPLSKEKGLKNNENERLGSEGEIISPKNDDIDVRTIDIGDDKNKK